MNTRWKEAGRETAVLLGMWAVAACGLMLIAQRSPSPRVWVNPAVFAPPRLAVAAPPAIPVLPASWRPDGATMLAQAKAAHRVYAPQSQVASHQPVLHFDRAKSDEPFPVDCFGAYVPPENINTSASFVGIVTRVFVYPGNTATCLNFAADYRKAVVAVVRPANYRKFPDLQKLVGKRVVFGDKMLAYRDPATVQGWRVEIELTSPSQLQIVK